MAYKLIVGPASEPLTLDEAKAHLRVDDNDSDDLITLYLAAARQNAEQFMGRALVNQVWDATFDGFPHCRTPMKLIPSPVLEVEGVFTSMVGEETEVSAETYRLDNITAPAVLFPAGQANWPGTTVDFVRVRFRAGYIDDDLSPQSGEVPSDIKAAILLNLGTLYENRETLAVGSAANLALLPWAAEQLLTPHRIHTGMA